MESTGGSSRRLTGTTSSPLSNTPHTTTTTTGAATTTTGATSTSCLGERQLPLSQSPTAAPTNTSSGAPNPLYSLDGELPEEVASYYEHWASPTEVLQLRSMCTDLVNKFKREAERCHRELEDVKRGRDELLREVQETRKLRQLYVTAEGEYEKTRRERTQWDEERELQRLQLQRLSVDNQRLRLALHRGRRTEPGLRALVLAPSSSGGAGAAFTTATTTTTSAPVTMPTTGSSIPTPSPTLSSSTTRARGGHTAQQQEQRPHPQHHGHHQYHHQLTLESGTGGMNTNSAGDDGGYTITSGVSGDSSEALREQLRLIEEIQRCSTEHAELEARFFFSQALWDLTATRDEQRAMRLVAENEKLKGQLRHWRSEAEDAAGRLDAATAQLHNCRDEQEDLRRVVRAAGEERQSLIEAERRAAQESLESLKATHAEELARAQQQLQLALDDAKRTRETLQRTLDDVQRQAEAQQTQLLAEVEGAVQKYDNAAKAQQEAVAALAEANASHEQQRETLEHEMEVLQSAQEQWAKERAEQAAALREVEDERAQLASRLQGAEEELQAVSGRLSAALEKLQVAGELEAELAMTRARAEEAELEVQTLQSYCEQQLRLHQTALAELQKQRDDEVLRLGRNIERLQRRYAAGKIRLAAALKGIGRTDAALHQPQDDKQQQQQQQQQKKEGENRRGSGVSEELMGPDAVTLLQQSAAIAVTLARTIHREARTA
ncbi:hypothetical protein DQ04_08081010 [Trypanosoma grayi]|uniref:hypothetical protein n=1 Tax=Trypanosoma grayi TaxID=71804 RepID=UPI0004F419BF|nr:hypothetical protein DQ04_08081010 [Trypanosoma grayi]KEG08068.1 hypothetical protein DQ04_08081010 [Trypanosoma grayi]